MERKGEGGRGEEEEREGHVFLTFRMVTGRASLGSDPWFIVKLRSRHRVKKARFSAAKQLSPK